jgi:hypothetical protein
MKHPRLALCAASLAPLCLALAWTAACGGSTSALPSDAKFDADIPRLGKDLTEFYSAPKVTQRQFEEDFAVAAGDWKVDGGRLVGRMRWDDLPTSGGAPQGAPMPLIFFKHKLPREFRVLWQARATEASGDLNAYFCANGAEISGYEMVNGGDRDREQKSWLRLVPEPGNMTERDYIDKVKPDVIDKNRTYEFEIRRTRRGIELYRDQERIMEDREELKLLDEDMRYFGLATWDGEAEFWGFEIEALSPK